jgi:DNA-binding beta-propeller fold protein YncE
MKTRRRRVGSGRAALTGGFFGVALLITVAAPRAEASGKLAPVGCISGSTEIQCVYDPTLTSPTNVAPSVAAVSPDGRSVYVNIVGGIKQFGRDPQTGLLTPRGCVGNAESGCETADLPGGNAVYSIEVSPDGASVYAVTDDAVVHLNRNPVSGQLAVEDCVADNDTGPPECSRQTNGLTAALEVAVSPDGTSVYAISDEDQEGQDNAIVRLVRDRKSGELSPRKDCIKDVDFGNDRCPTKVAALWSPGGMSFSPNGRSVYVAALADEAVHLFERNKQTGKLTSRGCVEDNEADRHTPCGRQSKGLEGAIGTGVSSDGRSVYVAALGDQAVASFHRDRHSGRLTSVGCIEDADAYEKECGRRAEALDEPRALVTAPDAPFAYVAADFDNAVAALRRTPGGKLRRAGCVSDPAGFTSAVCESQMFGLADSWSLSISPEGSHIYGLGLEYDAIAILGTE